MARVEINETVLRPDATSGELLAVTGSSVQVNKRSGGAATLYTTASGSTTIAQPLTTRYGRLEPSATPGGEVWVDAGSYDLVVDGATTARFEASVGGGGGGSAVTPFKPEDYGAIRDGVTNDTAAIRSCINAAVASATAANGYYAEVQFSAGIYQVSSSLSQGGTTQGNAQIPLPVVAPTAAKVTLVLRGAENVSAVPHWQQTVPQRAGSIIRTSLTGQAYSATYGQPSVIGGPTPEQNGYGASNPVFSNMLIVVRGLQVNAPVNPSLFGFDFRLLAAMDFHGACQAEQTPGTATLPASNFMSALAVPINANNAYSRVRDFACEGWYRGLLVGEHCHVEHCTIVHCARGLGFGGPNPHAMYVDVACIENCVYAVEYVDISPVAWTPSFGGAYAHIGQLQAEDGTGADAMQFLVNDAGNSLYGTINVADNGGATFALNGATNMRVNSLLVARGAFTPTLPATTVASTPIFRDMSLTVSGGTVTAIAVDGVAQGITSGTVFVPTGKTFAITYSVAPTLRAVRF